MRSSGIDPTAVAACMTASNATAAAAAPGGDFSNSLLQAELDLQAEMNIRVLPSATVEGVVLPGGLAPIGIVKAICASYYTAPGKAPLICRCTDSPLENIAACVAAAGSASPNSNSVGSGKMPAWGVALLIVALGGTFASIGVAIYIARRTRNDVQEILDEYSELAANDGDAEAGAGGAGAAPKKATASFKLPPGGMLDTIGNILFTPPETGSELHYNAHVRTMTVNPVVILPGTVNGAEPQHRTMGFELASSRGFNKAGYETVTGIN